MIISIIVAAAENNVIGKDNRLIWHLPADLKRFKSLTMWHPVIMGRKTYESIGKPLPGRTFIIITRQKDFKAEGCIVTGSLDAALDAASYSDEVFVIGGEEIFRVALPLADKIYLTKIHQAFEGDTFFTSLDERNWKETERADCSADEKNLYDYSFCVFEKVNH